MKIGKIAADKLKNIVLDKIKYHRNDVLVHAGIGEDTAVVDFGENVLVISSDPITGAANNAGYLAVHVACNDLAATGARPVGIQVVLLLPDSTREGDISLLMEEMNQTAVDLEIEVLGGHTEILSTVVKPLIIVTAVGKAVKDRYVHTGGAKIGDKLILTKGPGIEGTYILANDYGDILLERGVDSEVIARARGYKEMLSVLPEGLIGARNGAHAMHDVTEGGLYGALEEMARASGTGFELDLKLLEVTSETEEITTALDIDPAGLLSSGSMLIAASEVEKMLTELKREGIKAFVIGKVIREGQYIKDEKGELAKFSWAEKDELWRLMDSGILS